MTFRADILIRSPDNRIIAIIEVKNRQDLSRNIAMILRRNMMAHGLLPQTLYFVLLSQDIGFLWKGSEQENLQAPPAVEFSMKQIMDRYLPEMNPEERLRGAELELLVLQWLTDLTWGSQETIEEPEKSLAPSKFLEAIQGATVTAEAQLYDRVR